MSTPATLGRPSDERRRQLNEELTLPLVSNFFPIERYYDAADKVYHSFQEAFTTSGRLDDAYVYGKRYCSFCLDAIPTHNYFTAERYRSLSVRHNKQVKQVLTQLAAVADQMDVEEAEKQRKAAEEARKRAAEQARVEAQKFKDLQQRASKFTSTPTKSASQSNVQASAMNKLEMLRTTAQKQEEVGTGRVRRKGHSGAPTTTTATTAAEDGRIIKRDPSGEEPGPGIPSSRYRLLSDSEDEDGEEKKSGSGGSVLVLPPPVPPPTIGGSAVPASASAPPSYDQALAATQRNGRYHRTFLGPQPGAPEMMTPTHPQLVPTPPPPPKRQERTPMRQLQEEYRKQYVLLMSKQRIEVSGVDTYQGRNGSSTNGCTVISALVAARHLSGRDGAAISDSGICEVIDRQCGPLLGEIRSKLGLGGHALIIPSDVHDHLVDKKLLQQKYFEGAAGGNVMDPAHMGEFLKLLSVGEDGKGSHRKAAATFFFHEHVVSIVKIPITNNGRNACYYDLVDSLPSLNNGGRSKATRTRATDIESLAALLRWYTSRKFSEANCSYIDRNAWDDTMADFDPRVFQGFVWHVK